MRARCGRCLEWSPRVGLRRLGSRLLCGRCHRALTLPRGPESAEDRALRRELDALRGFTRALGWAGLGAKVALYVLLFRWAAGSELGAAALEGIVAADVVTWLIFSVVDRHFRGLRVTASLLFEAAVVVVYLNRHSLFDLQDSAASMGLKVLFATLATVVKAGLWGAERALEGTGVREGSPA